MRRVCAVALSVSICACAQTGLIPSDAGPDTETATDPEQLEPGDLLWAAAIEMGMASDVMALPDGDLLAAGMNGDGAVFHGAASGEIAVDAAGAFLARYTSAGEIASVESPIVGAIWPIHADRAADGSLFLSGSFYPEATFGPGSPAEVTLTSQSDDGYVARLDAEAEMAWVARLHGTGYESLIDVAALPGGAVAVVGTFGYAYTDDLTPQTATLATGTGSDVELESAGSGDILAAAFAADGSLQWFATAGGAGFDLGYAVDARADGSVAIAGQFGDDGNLSAGNECSEPGAPAMFGAGPEAIILPPAGATDGFVAAYGADGALEWARSVGGPCKDWVRDVVALDDGSVVAAGVIGGPAVFGAGEPNETAVDCGELGTCDDMQRAFVAAFDASGELEWVRTSGFCTGDAVGDGSIDIRADELARGPGGALAIAGAYRGACGFGSGEPGEIALPTTNGMYDPFLAAFEPDGALLWAATGVGETEDEVTAAAFTANGNLCAAGYYNEVTGDNWGIPFGPLTLGAGERNETVLDVENGHGFVAAFAGQ
jgi:hypothetical protein